MDYTRSKMEYTDFIDEWNNGSEHITAHTSGSTGTPKPIHLLKSDMLRSANATIKRFGLDKNCVIASLLPISSIATKMAIVRSIAAGCRYINLHPANDFEIPEHIDLLSVGPSQCDCLIAHPDMAQQIRVLLVGGAELSRKRRDALLALGYDLYESYGMTETCSNVALRHGADDFFEANEGINFCLDNRSCIVVEAPAYGFDGTITNDIAVLQAPDRFRLLGRYDNVINSGGLKIHPEQLERELAPLLDIPFYIVGVPDDKWGQSVAIVIEGSQDDAQKASNRLEILTDGRKRPKRVIAMAEFERTSSGKIKRKLP